jgi:hypothetical protein
VCEQASRNGSGSTAMQRNAQYNNAYVVPLLRQLLSRFDTRWVVEALTVCELASGGSSTRQL